MRRPLSLALTMLVALGLGLWAEDVNAAKCPNLVIVLDRSGSMESAPDGGSAMPPNRKWDIAVAAVESIIKEYDGQLPMGLSMFASDGSCGGGILDVPPAYDSGKQILQEVHTATPNSATPTGDTVKNMAKEAILRDPSREQYLLLITDGDPNCSSGTEPDYTVKAIADAFKQTPSIKTFVVGFGALPTSASMAMDQMAEAGGQPLKNQPRKYYAAENGAALNAALRDIFRIVTGGEDPAMFCDDTCYSNGCSPCTQCIRGECKQNPCSGVVCGPGRYCYSDGVQPGRCVAACTRRCPDGTRCEMGSCIKSDCPAPCIAGFVCNPASKRCEADPLCPDNVPRRQQCKAPSRCQAGTCVDDPCLIVKCPTGNRCVPWNGSCEYVGSGVITEEDMAAPDIDTGERDHRGGCNAASSAAAGGSSLFAGLGVLLAFGLLRRRRA